MLLVASRLQCSVARICTRTASGTSARGGEGGICRSGTRGALADGDRNQARLLLRVRTQPVGLAPDGAFDSPERRTATDTGDSIDGRSRVRTGDLSLVRRKRGLTS